MTDRHLSNRFERGTRERRLLRLFEHGFIFQQTEDIIALLDFNTQHDMVLYAMRNESCDYAVWMMETDPDGFEDQVYEFNSYEDARQWFDKYSGQSLEPNWEAQAEYDELHGTINGEDAGIVAMRELWGE